MSQPPEIIESADGLATPDRKAARLFLHAVSELERGLPVAPRLELMKWCPEWQAILQAALKDQNGGDLKSAIRHAIDGTADPARFRAALGPEWRAQDASIDNLVQSLRASHPSMARAQATWNRTDVGQAEMLAHVFGDRLRFDHARQRWLVWNTHCWKPDADAEVERLAKATVRERFTRAWDLEDPDEREAEAKWAIRAEFRIRGILERARAERPIADAGDGWDANPWLLGVPNGVVDLRTGELRAGRQEDRITMQAGAAYEPEAACPRWLEVLNEIFAGDVALVEFVQRAAGYSLAGVCSEEVILTCYGQGANGKSTFLEILRAAAGDYGYNIPFATLELHARTSIPDDLASLVGRRLVTASETNEGTRLNEARVKTLTGRDKITARHLYGRFFEFQPRAVIWLAVNHKPVVRDDSYAFWRRLLLVPFLQTFGPGQADKHLKAKLQNELPGILAWMIRGCMEWHRTDDLSVPVAVDDATAAYREEMDPLGTFISECCVEQIGVSASAGELWGAYQAHSKGDAAQISTQRAFAERLKARGLHNDKGTQGKRIWRGIGLRADRGEDREQVADVADSGATSRT